jgi:hypothetical protein
MFAGREMPEPAAVRSAAVSLTLSRALAVAFSLWIGCLVAYAEPVPIASGQSHYLESCGGCHGIEGNSSPRDIPELRGTVGRFLCSRAGREYIVRLPNVAFAAVNDQTLADLLNFMVFRLGGSSTPTGALPYTKTEVGRLRREPLKSRSLEQLRAAVLVGAAKQCATHDSQH